MTRPSEVTNSYYQESLRVLNFAGSIMPLVVIVLGLLVKFGIMDNRFYAGDMVYAMISAGFIVAAGINSYFVYVRKNMPLAVYLFLSIFFHCLGIAFLLFVTGLFSPFLVAWVLLVIAVDIYFGSIATFLSLLTLLGAVIMSFSLYPLLKPEEVVSVFVALLFISTTCVILAKLRSINDKERLALQHTRDQATFQRERLLALINSMGDAVITTDENGIIRVYNAATLNLLDTNADIAGKNIDNIVQFKDAKGKRVLVIDEALKKRMVASRDDLTHVFPDGEVMRLYVNVAPVQPGYRAEGERGFIFIMRDITKQKTLEEERDEFVSVVSHELRTPLAIAEGSLSNISILQERGADKKVVSNAAKSAHEQIVYLAKLVNDLGTLARAERALGHEAPDIIATQNFLQDIYNTYSPQAVAKNLHFNLDIAPNLPNIKTSRLYLQEILQNFIGNAIKYTKSGSVTLKARSVKEGLEISVIDTGIGISKADQKHIFEKFYRSEDYRTRETSGTGLGLYVCKKLAEKLGMPITFASRLNHGSTFTLLVPKSKLTREAAKASATSGAAEQQ